MFHHLRTWWHRNAPTRESLEQVRWMRPFAHRVLEPSLWRFTRRSVPRGVALGIVVGIFLMIPGVQVAGAALLALPCRANVPIAMAMTFLSNPVTTPFILYSAIVTGNRFVGGHVDIATINAMIAESATMREWVDWLASSAAPALVMGLFVMATILAAIGYLVSSFAWRFWIARKWTLRARNRGVSRA